MDPTKDTINRVRKTISSYNMIEPGDLLITAVSGGPDSVCLLDILHELRDELRIKVIVAHYDHGLRKAEDEEETQFVRRLATTMNLPFETEKAGLLKNGSKTSLEEKARNARYDFLERLRHKVNAQRIAVGHNMNDQAETVIMRFLRGSGPAGLSGIPPCRDNVIIRPLIEIKRKEIESYLRARKLSYVIDSSNLDTGYLRNKIRLELLPSLLEYQPRLVEHLGQLTVILREENDYLETVAEKWVEQEAKSKPVGEIIIPSPSFVKLSQPVRNRVIRNILLKINKNLRRIDQRHIQSIYNLARGNKPQGMINLPKGLIVKRSYEKLSFGCRPEQTPQDFQYSLEGPGTVYLEQIDRSINVTELEGHEDFSVDASNHTAYLDANKAQYPLLVRNFHPGDRFVPLGMKGRKKIKDFFTDLKIPSEMRAIIPILISRDIPVWICGHRIDERFKVATDTIKILKVTIY